MAIVSILVLVVFVLSALLLMLVVLIQDDQGGGIGGLFGGEGSSAFGSRSGNVLTRMTAILAVVFFASAFSLAWFNRTPDTGNVIGRARAERARTIERTDWWVETPAPSTDAQGAGDAPGSDQQESSSSAPAESAEGEAAPEGQQDAEAPSIGR